MQTEDSTKESRGPNQYNGKKQAKKTKKRKAPRSFPKFPTKKEPHEKLETISTAMKKAYDGSHKHEDTQDE